MNKFLSHSTALIIGLFLGWLYPIEGPLDWTYDNYASRPSQKTQRAQRVAPKQEIKEDPAIEIDLDNEQLFIRLLKKLETYDL